MFYAANIKRLKSKKEAALSKYNKEIMDYFSSIPMTADTKGLGTQLQLFTHNLSDILDPEEHFNFIIKMTTFRHISIMVGKIAVCLTRFLIEKNPECFAGCMGFETVDEITGNKDKLFEFAETSGLCHDVGSVVYVGNPFLLVRILTEDEKLVIKNHPEEGKSFMARKDGVSLYDAYIDVIWGHHRHFDGKGGYPINFDINESKNKAMISIISVADSIEAATDDIGKLYSDAKSLDTICEEIMNEAGTRYSPEIAMLLKDEAVKKELRRILNEERTNAYYNAYLHAWS
jgi:hypothetical protein